MTAPVRIPCTVPLTNREQAFSGASADFLTDTLLVNCEIEVTPEGKKFAVKRPGMLTAFTYNGGAATNGQGTVYYKGFPFAMGSNTLYQPSGIVVGSTNGTAWAASTTAPWQGRSNFASAMLNGSFIVMGGLSTGATVYLNDVWSTDDGVNWVQLTSAAPWAGRYDAQAAVIGNTLYLMGGIKGATKFNDVWATKDGINWTQVVTSAPWSARNKHRAVAFNNGIMLMGGQDATANWLNDVWFTPDGVTWSALVLNATWSARGYFACVSFNGFVWVLGGTGGAGDVASIYKTTDGLNWTNTGNLAAPAQQMGYCVYSGFIWLLIAASVYKTSDGITVTLTSAAYGGASITGETLAVLRTPLSVSTIQATTIWLIGGYTGVSFLSLIYRATINVPLAPSFAIATAGPTTEQFQFETQNLGDYLVFKNTEDAWVFYSGIVQKITDPNYPTSTVPGIVNLDDTIYVMDANGVITGSNLSTPFVWSSLNFITADYAADTGIAIYKQLERVVAFKSTTIQFFYDAGRFPGSPLLPDKSLTVKVGCAHAGSIAKMMNTLVFMAQSNTAGRYIAYLDGYTPTPISTPDVNRILDSWNPSLGDPIYAWGAKLNGHDVYILTFGGTQGVSTAVTLRYDFTTREWNIWEDTTGDWFKGINYFTDGVSDYVQHPTIGKVLSLSPRHFNDDGTAFHATGYLDLVDAGNNKRKFVGKTTIIGDRRATVTPNNLSVSWSDDDRQTYTTPIIVDLTSANPQFSRGGSFYRRAYKFDHFDGNNPMRLEAIELEAIGGS